MMLYSEGKSDAQQHDANRILELLTTCYPGHPWAVRIDHGIIFIRHLGYGDKSRDEPGWGMNLKTREVDHDWAVLKKKIVMGAGEWLERAGLARGRYDADQHVEHVDGVPQRKSLDDVVLEYATPAGELRDAPRPQVIKGSNG